MRRCRRTSRRACRYSTAPPPESVPSCPGRGSSCSACCWYWYGRRRSSCLRTSTPGQNSPSARTRCRCPVRSSRTRWRSAGPRWAELSDYATSGGPPMLARSTTTMLCSWSDPRSTGAPCRRRRARRAPASAAARRGRRMEAARTAGHPDTAQRRWTAAWAPGLRHARPVRVHHGRGDRRRPRPGSARHPPERSVPHRRPIPKPSDQHVHVRPGNRVAANRAGFSSRAAKYAMSVTASPARAEEVGRSGAGVQLACN